MTNGFAPSLMCLCAIVTACGPSAPKPPNGGAEMPTLVTQPAPASLPADSQSGSLSITNAKIRKPIKSRPTAGYFVMSNAGAQADTLNSVSSPDFERVELHDHIMDGAMMKMVKLASLEVPATAQIAFAPGGKHLMLFNSKRPLNTGDNVKLTLTFANAGPIETSFVVLAETLQDFK
jgi:periplasmic copper chaperone A